MANTKDSISSKLSAQTNKNQPALRLIVNLDFIDEPLRYAQSTSGRKDSAGTCPPLSRSRAITVDSAIRSFVDMAFRKYPTDVSHLRAYDSWSGFGRELRYVRSDSISRSLPNGKPVSIPNGNLPFSNHHYHAVVDRKQLKELRFRNFDELYARYGNSPTKFCEETGYPNPTVLSQLKGRNRAFGGDLARELEGYAGLERYALENEAGIGVTVKKPYRQTEDWPFSMPLKDIVELRGKHFKDIDEALTKMVMGAQAQEMFNKERKGHR